MAQINKSSEYFNTVLWTGTGSAMSITGVGFQPDLVWYKGRSFGYNHGLFDVVRGTSKFLKSNSTDAEAVVSGVTAFNSDGFSLGTDAGGVGSGNIFVGWNWKANGAGVANGAGSIISTVSVNTTSGFSIVTYTSPNSASDQTVGHGLGVAPSFIITKNLDNNYNWDIHHKSLSSGNGLIFSTDTPRAGVFGSMTNTTFGTKNGYTHNSTHRYVAYCFAEKKGFSKFGSYTGNGSADGTFVYTGFKPAFVLIKATTNANDNWHTHDTKRLGYNGSNYPLQPNLNNAESTNNYIDIVSNGFKNRSSGSATNGGTDTYIYMAFAENPLVGTNDIPTTAR
jgi:hypothetical protein